MCATCKRGVEMNGTRGAVISVNFVLMIRHCVYSICCCLGGLNLNNVKFRIHAA